MGGLAVRIAVAAAALGGALAPGEPAWAAAERPLDAAAAVAAAPQTAGAAAAPVVDETVSAVRGALAGRAPGEAREALEPPAAPAPAGTAEAPSGPARATTRAERRAASRPAVPDRASTAARTRRAAKSSSPPHGRGKPPARSHGERAAGAVRTPHEPAAPDRRRAPRLPGLIGAATAAGPGADALFAAVLVALLGGSLRLVFRRLEPLVFTPSTTAFASPLERPG